MQQARQAVRESYLRVWESEEFFTRFYAQFFARSPVAKEKFKAIPLGRQKLALKAALHKIVVEEHEPVRRGELCDRLAATHGPRGMKIHPFLYMHWLDALCGTLAEFDPQWNADLEEQWRKVVVELIDLICARHSLPAAAAG